MIPIAGNRSTLFSILSNPKVILGFLFSQWLGIGDIRFGIVLPLGVAHDERKERRRSTHPRCQALSESGLS